MAGYSYPKWYRYVEIGAKLAPWEWALTYAFPLLFIGLSDDSRGRLGPGSDATSSLVELVVWNMCTQVLLFVVVVQIPAFVTNTMAYVDIGWPWGLVLLSLNGFFYGQGWWFRRSIACLCVFLHGLRMAVGALLLFGKQTNWTYRWEKDLPRYEFARVRWEKEMPKAHWWYKIQHDTLQQCFANCFMLALPVVLAAGNPKPLLHPLEMLGWGMWLAAWLFENQADFQKQAFLAKCKAKAQGASIQEKAAIKIAVLGYAPWDKEYYLWTLCRHPNYFGEWMAWMGLSLSATPSVFNLWKNGGLSTWRAVGLGVMLVYVVRIFYDCLVHWTGAGPAEHFSVKKRPSYREYQKSVRCFFPFEMPFVDHHRLSGWPDVDVDNKTR
ncbi:hypothetical protein AAMO2058_001465800 [Amorphochlora amoebiformis]